MGKAMFATGVFALLAAIALGVWWPSIQEARAKREARSNAENYMGLQLRGFSAAQEIFRRTNGHYAQQMSDLRYAGFTPPRGIRMRLVQASRGGYVVEASIPSLDLRCTTWRGTVGSPPEGQVATEVVCE